MLLRLILVSTHIEVTYLCERRNVSAQALCHRALFAHHSVFARAAYSTHARIVCLNSIRHYCLQSTYTHKSYTCEEEFCHLIGSEWARFGDRPPLLWGLEYAPGEIKLHPSRSVYCLDYIIKYPTHICQYLCKMKTKSTPRSKDPLRKCPSVCWN